MKPKTIEAGQGHYILYDASLVEQADPRWFDPAYWHESDQVIAQASGRGSSLIVRHGDAHWVLRQYRRGGLRAKLGDRDYWWSGLHETRAWGEWHLLASMRAQGLAVPAPVAAQVTRHGLFYRAAIITGYIEDSMSLSQCLQKSALDASQWCRLGACLYRFHHANIYHADLNAHNILLQDGSFHLIDFDRGERRSGGRWREQNLRRLRRSLDKLRAIHPAFHFTEDDWRSLLAGYRRGSLLFADECA